MTFKAKGGIFKNTPEKLQKLFGERYDASKKYPDVDGFFSIREEERLAFASYIMNADPNEKGEIMMRISGYNNTSQTTGMKYLGITIEPDFKTQKGIEAKQAAAAAAKPDPAAQIAQAFDGAVIEDDLF